MIDLNNKTKAILQGILIFTPQFLLAGILLVALIPVTTARAEVSPELLEKSKAICNKVTACYEGVTSAKSPKKLKCDAIQKECKALLNLKMLPLASEEYKQSISSPVWPGVWETGIDSEINWGNGKIYFFKKSQYLRFDTASNKVDSGYPKKISSSTWPGLWTDGIDAAVNLGNGKAFFFKKNQYIQFDIAKNRSDSGYPKTVDEKSWPGIWSNGFDTVTNWGNGKAYFFKGNQYVSFDIDEKLSDPEYPKNIDDRSGILWSGISGDIKTSVINKNVKAEESLESNISEKYLGCFKDQQNRDLSGFQLKNNKMKISRCIMECGARGYRYAGVQYTEYCLCGNSYGKTGITENCNMPCAGNKEEICGGSWANSVYEVINKKEAELTEESFRDSLWQFGRSDGSVIIDSIKLLTGGKIEGYSHLNEDRWGVEDGNLVFYRKDGDVSCRFSLSQKHNNLRVLSGEFLFASNTIHVLTEKVDQNKSAKQDILSTKAINGIASLDESGIEKNNKTKDLLPVDLPIVIQETPAKVTSEKVQNLFDGKLGDQWLELSTSGGDYSKFAQIKDEMLVVDVPAGNSWGKTGIRSADTLFKIPNESENKAVKLTFNIEPEESTGFVFAIIPTNWNGVLEWRSHLVRLQANKNDNETVTLSLRIRTKELMKTVVDIKQIEQLNIIIRSDKIVTVTDKDNNLLLQALMNKYADIYPEGYKISALTHSNEKNLPAKLILKSIGLAEVEYKKEVDTSITPQKLGETTLFDGELLGHRWVNYQLAKVDFDRVAKLTQGTLTVDVPENSGHANVGIKSSEPIVWLDQFGDGSEREVVFDFLPNETSGFAIALSNRGNHFIVKWVKDSVTDTALLQIYLSTNLGLIGNWNSSYTPVWEQKLSTQSPSQVKLTLTPQGIRLSGNNLPEHLQAWEYLKANTGYQIYAYSFPLLPKQAVKMALKQITLNLTKPVPLAQSELAENIEPLPVKTFFDGSKVQDWVLTPWRIKKDAVDPCHLDEKGFSVFDVPEGTSSDGCDIHTSEPIITIDERIDKTAYKITAEFDAKTTKNFQVVVTPHTRGSWNRYYEACYAQLFQNKQAEHIFSLNCGGNKSYWQRQVSADWLTSEWDGMLTVTIEKEWLQAQLGNGQTIRIAHASPPKLYIYVVALDYRYAANKTAFMLKKLTGQWIAPEGMTALKRWFYLNLEEFDPESYMRDLANDMPFPEGPHEWGEDNE